MAVTESQRLSAREAAKPAGVKQLLPDKAGSYR
jgi:hypothetical protein